MNLTDTFLRALKPSGKLERHTDGRGLTLEVRPTGRMYWRLRYRFDGKPNMLTLGEYPTVKLKAARTKAESARVQIAGGIDPAAEKREQKQAVAHAKVAQEIAEASQFEVVAREWFEKFEKDLSPSHAKRQLRRLEVHVFPWLGTDPIGEIKPRDLLTVLERVVDGGSLETAHRIKFLCGQIFRYAIVAERADRDVTQDLRGALPSKKKGVFAAVTEPAEIGPVLRMLHDYNGTLPVKCALKLAPLVFCRPGELRHAKWAEIDLNAAEWRFNLSKRKSNQTGPANHIVPLSSQAVEVLRELQPLTGENKFVFPSARPTPTGDHERPMSENTVNAALRRMDITKDTLCGHGFRAMARTVLDEVLNFPVDIIEHQLGHAVKDANGRSYNRTTHLPQRREMLQSWADYLDQLRTGADVVQLAAHRNG